MTDEATMEIAEMVINKVNKSLVQLVNELGVKAVGISGKDGLLLPCKKKYSGGQDIGFVGEVTTVNPKILYDLLEKDFLPIVCPIGFDEEFQTYNINADDAACAIATAVKAEKLAFLTDVEGVYRDFEDKNSLISEMTLEEAQDFVNSGTLGGGMLPKLQNCIDAIEEGKPGFKIYIGGRWGKKIAHGQPLSKIFTSEEEVLNVVEKAILFFREQGKTGERFADTIARLGFDYVEKELLSDDILARKDAILAAELHLTGGATC